MSRIRVYIKPFQSEGVYGEYQEVTSYVDAKSITSLKRVIDSTEYDVGVIKINYFTITLLNKDGTFSDIETLRSIFVYKRSDSLIKIVWDPNDYDLQCGAVTAGHLALADEGGLVVFEGMINDEATSQNIKDQTIKFKCFGFEYTLDRTLIPYSSISNGDLLSTAIYTMLNQEPFNTLVNVDSGNINLGSDVTIDDKTDLENKTVMKGLRDILLAGNAVLYIESGNVYVKERTASATNQYTFYGQAAVDGTENIETINNYRTGLHRVFNYWTWEDTSLLSFDSSSNSLFGIKSKELSLKIVTGTTSRNTILGNLKDEFYARRKELELTVKLNHDRLALKMLDRVNIDYPNIVYMGEGELLPIYGTSRYGESSYPLDEFAFTISKLDYFKIVGITYDLKTERIIYKLREI